MKKLSNLAFVTLLFFTWLSSDLKGARTWENLEGVKIKAELLAVEGDVVVLLMDANQFRVPLQNLSEKDQDYIDDWLSQKERRQALAEARMRFRGGKKGFCIATGRNPAWREKLEKLEVGWFYNWASRTPSGESVPAEIEYVPMVFGRSGTVLSAIDTIRESMRRGAYGYLLGHNEPDNFPQANRTVEDVLHEWPMLMSLGLPLVSPATTHPDDEWMIEFMKGVEEKGYRVDFVAVHSYGPPNPDRFIRMLEETYRRYGRPIWITEFAVGDWQADDVSENRHTPSQIQRFMRSVLPRLERMDFIYRYAWYSADPDHPNLGPSALFDADGQLTRLGEIYARHKSAVEKSQIFRENSALEGGYAVFRPPEAPNETEREPIREKSRLRL